MNTSKIQMSIKEFFAFVADLEKHRTLIPSSVKKRYILYITSFLYIMTNAILSVCNFFKIWVKQKIIETKAFFYLHIWQTLKWCKC